jgi:site-specific DNA recombinase
MNETKQINDSQDDDSARRRTPADASLSGKNHTENLTSVVKATTLAPGPVPTGRPAPSELQSGGHTPAEGRAAATDGETEASMTDISTVQQPRYTDIAGLEHLAATSGSKSQLRTSIVSNQAVLYLRVSTERQLHTAADIDGDGNSIATQRQAALVKASVLKAAVAKEFVEPGASAQTIAKRPVFREMLSYIDEHPEVGYVIIYMRSRVFRNFTDAAITKRALLEKGVRLISTKEEFGDGYMADAMEAITDIMNEVQVRQSGEDIKVKMRHKAESGGTVGRAKLGYLNDRQNFGGRLVNTISIDPDRARLIAWAFEAYATGEYTLVSLLSELTEQGLTTRATVRWNEQPLSHSQLSQILHDPYYTGVVRFKGELFPGRHEPLISKELFLRVQDVLAERAKRGQRDRTHHHYLKGLLYCRRCAHVGRTSRLVFIQAESKGSTYNYYLCRGRQEGVCDLPYLPAAEVEDAASRCFAAEQERPDFLASLRTQVEGAMAENTELDQEMRSNLAKQLKKLDVREERLLDLASDGELSTPKLRARLATIALERGALEERLTRTDADFERGAKTLLTYLDMLADPRALYDGSTEEIRRRLLEAFYERLEADSTDRITLEGAHRPSVQDLHHAADAYREEHDTSSSAEVQKRKNPRLSTGALAFGTSVGSLADLFRASVSSKATLVAGTGFEPATSGL